MKILRSVFTVLIIGILSVKAAEPSPSEHLQKAHWKHRVFLVHHPDPDANWKAIFKHESEAIKDRHLKFIPADTSLRAQYKIKPEQLTVVLIGKDGGEKSRQTDQIDLKKFFALIDGMPMRREEMRRKSKVKKR